jgi:hypothetical protein
MAWMYRGNAVAGNCTGEIHKETNGGAVRRCNAGCWDGGVFRGAVPVTQSGFSATVTHRAGSGSKGVGFDVVGFQAGTYDL